MPTLTPELLSALAMFAFASSVTPGPNNTMLMASGANFGLKRTVPHMLGVGVGFVVLILAIGLVLGGVFAAYPSLHQALKVVGAAYLLYLAWKIARSGQMSGGGATGSRPFSFLQALLFQWVNPKAWMMAISGVTAYATPDAYVANVAAVALVFGVVNVPCIAIWAGFGVSLRGWLTRPGRLRTFNWVMAGLLVLSVIPIFTAH